MGDRKKIGMREPAGDKKKRTDRERQTETAAKSSRARAALGVLPSTKIEEEWKTASSSL